MWKICELIGLSLTEQGLGHTYLQYVFFKPMPTIEYIDGCKAHVFECAAKSCHCRSRLVQWFLDTGDAKLTSNLCRHAKVCWGEEAVLVADNTQDMKTA